MDVFIGIVAFIIAIVFLLKLDKQIKTDVKNREIEEKQFKQDFLQKLDQINQSIIIKEITNESKN